MHYIKAFIGRFQPFHKGHLKVLRAAIDTSDLVVVIIGSSDKLRSMKNPFTATERRMMIEGALRPKELKKVVVLEQQDMPGTDEAWAAAIKANVSTSAHVRFPWEREFTYTLIGCHKGAETYYLGLFPSWNKDLAPQSEALNATDVRRHFFADEDGWRPLVPPTTAMFLSAFRFYQGPDFQVIQKRGAAEINR